MVSLSSQLSIDFVHSSNVYAFLCPFVFLSFLSLFEELVACLHLDVQTARVYICCPVGSKPCWCEELDVYIVYGF
jgi:hypothetical protein